MNLYIPSEPKYSHNAGRPNGLSLTWSDVSMNKEECCLELNCKCNQKANTIKAAMSLIPGKPMLEVGKVFAFGAKKYAKNSWRNPPYTVSAHLDALGRHLAYVQTKEDVNEEDGGVYHLAQVATRALMALEQILVDPKMDDR